MKSQEAELVTPMNSVPLDVCLNTLAILLSDKLKKKDCKFTGFGEQKRKMKGQRQESHPLH